jgi:hypothetical protein
MEAPVKAIAAPVLPKSVQLNEDAQLRVLSGRTTYVAEAKKMKEEDEMKVGDSKKTATGGTVTKTKTGIVHKAGNNYSGKAAEKEDKKKKDESIEEASDKKTAAQEKFKAMIAKKKGDKKEEVKEGSKPDFLDIDGDGDKKEPMKKAAADKKKGSAPKKGVNPFAKKNESAMMPKGKKRPVKESFEPKLTFKEMVKLVQESGGQQQIDAVDKELFAWAKRVASTKFNESTKAELYAGVVYERMGGAFEMYDVLAETQK